MYAAELGNAVLAALLVDHEAKILDVYGRTALMRAMKHGYIDCFHALLSHEVLVRSSKGLSVLDLCLKWALEGVSDFEDLDDEAFSTSTLDCDSTDSLPVSGPNLAYNEIATSKIKLMENDYISTSTPCLQLRMDNNVDESNPNMAPLMQNISFSSNLTPNSEVLSFTTDSSAGLDMQLGLTDLSFTSEQLPGSLHQSPGSLNAPSTTLTASEISNVDANVL